MNNNPQNPENPEKKPFDEAEYNREYQKEYRRKNAEKNKAYQKEYREKHKEENKAYQKEYREEHKEENKAYQKEYRESHKEENKAYQKEYYEEHKEERKAYTKSYGKNYREKNKEKLIEDKVIYIRERKKIDPAFKLRENMRGRLNSALRCQNTSKNQRTMDLVGCTPEFLRSYLESLFTEGMTWDNYGPKGWHVDHILPCASFDLTKEEEQKKCFHYTNLQPLWWFDNLKKSDKIL